MKNFIIVFILLYASTAVAGRYDYGNYPGYSQQQQMEQQQQQIRGQQRQFDEMNRQMREQQQIQDRQQEKANREIERINRGLENFKPSEPPTYIINMPSDTGQINNNPSPITPSSFVSPQVTTGDADNKTKPIVITVKNDIRIEEIKSKIKQNPSDQNLHIMLGDFYLENQAMDHAIDAYKIASMQEPKNNYVVYNKIAKAIVEKTKKNQSRECFKDIYMSQVLDSANAAISLNNNNIDSYVIISEGYLHFKDNAMAIKYLNKALAINSDDNFANYYLGIAFNNLNDKQKAFSQYMKLRQIENNLNINEHNQSLSNKLFSEIYK